MKKTFDFTVDDMTCGGCVKRITLAINKLDDSAEVNADLATKSVHLETRVSDFNIITQELDKIGYKPILK
ncbi:copper chaperone [bacterium]|nr:MAG: copper chaperone [bacterium]